MSDKRAISINFGGGFFLALTTVFITLKLAGATEVATWSWWWVFGPLWIPAAIGLSIFAVCILFVFLCAILAAVLS